MRIAQIAPLTEAIPPKLYGGTERVVHWLTEELVALGHDVTLFASGDSLTAAKLEPMWPQSLRLSGSIRDPLEPSRNTTRDRKFGCRGTFGRAAMLWARGEDFPCPFVHCLVRFETSSRADRRP